MSPGRGGPIIARVPAPRARTALLHAALVAAVVVAAYAVAIPASFHFDDESQVVHNPCGDDLACYLLGATGPAARRVGYATFGLNRALTGPSPSGFRVVNVAIHLAAALLLYAFVATTLRAADRERRLGDGQVAGASLLAALLFAAHPVQTQAVTYVVQRFASLAAAFSLAALVLYARSRLQPRAGARAWAGLAGAVACAVAAMRTKEIAFTLPLAVLAWDLAFAPGPARRRWTWLAPMLATLPLVPLAWLRLDQPVSAVLAEASSVTQVQTQAGRLDYLATQWRVVLGYLRMLAWPSGQSIDHDVAVQPWPWGWEAFAAGLALAALLGLGIWLLVRARAPELRAAGFGVLLFFLSLAVESTVIPIADVFVEHRVYLPAAGAALAAAGAALHLARRLGPGRQRALAVVLGAWVAALTVTTVARNLVWRDPVSLWSDAVEKAPRRARVHYNLGEAYRNAGDMARAQREWKAALALQPWHAGSLTQMGALALLQGDRAGAEELLRRAITSDPENGPALFNLAGILQEDGREGEALATYRRFVEVAPTWMRPIAREVRAHFGWPPAGPVPR